jgi:hypothetical protein
VQLAAPAADHEPAAHAVQLAAPAGAHVPAAHAEHTEFAVAEQLATRSVPAGHARAAAQAAQGAKPEGDHVAPATQAGMNAATSAALSDRL